MLHCVRVIALGIAGAIAAPAQVALTPPQRSANIESFEKVWTTVRDKHWDPKPGGLDWQAAYDELRPKIEAAKNMDEARQVMNNLVGRLKQSHFGIFSGDVYQDLKPSDSRNEPDSDQANPGIDLRVLDGHAVVTEVAPGSPAAAKSVSAIRRCMILS